MIRRACLVFVLATAVGSDHGPSHRDYTGYAVGGIITKINEFSFMAALGWRNDVTGKIDYLAGGMLITRNTVLTAAHCVLHNGKRPDVVTIGSNNLTDPRKENYLVKDYFIYPEYDSRLAYHDIAILLLDSDCYRSPVCLWTGSTLSSPNVTAIGFGATQFAGQRSSDLLKVSLTIFSEKECKKSMKRQRKFPSGLLPSHICAGDREKRRDTCQGDSGGPLIFEYEGTKYAVGITSTGQACSGLPPAIYTRIKSYLQWIKNTAEPYGDHIQEYCHITLSYQ